MTAVETPVSARVESVSIAAAALAEHVQDGTCTGRIVIDGLTRQQWEAIEAHWVTPTIKRETLRDLGGRTVIELEYWTEEPS